MNGIRKIVLASSVVVLAGCYHATVRTAPLGVETAQTESKWAHSWIYGLVPPSTVDGTEVCPQGVARTETELSFVNQLVGALTLGIYTPMTIKTTCIAE